MKSSFEPCMDLLAAPSGPTHPDPWDAPQSDLGDDDVDARDTGQAPDARGASMSATVDPVFIELYDRLKVLASRQRARNGNPATLCTTELVHEMYIRLGESDFECRRPEEFYSYVARAMRFILTDAARRRRQPKRGGDLARLELSDPAVDSVYVDPDLALQLDEALTALQRTDERAARVVELHFFAGLDLSAIADSIGIARRTVDRDWRFARAFLARHSGGEI